jgi:protein tyrosine phosphatase (PTP) superfamily phosphohydrolase (DUF442 family)
VHIPVRDHLNPSKKQVRKLNNSYKKLPRPVLVHCSAGRYRTGYAIRHLKRRLRKG